MRSLSAAPGLDALACQLFDDGVPAPPRGEDRFGRQEVAAVLELIQLVQNVFTEFHLEHAANRANPRNSGWMGMFHRWAKIDVVDRVWRARQADYNPLFQQFMEELRNGHDTAGDRPLRP